MDPVPREYCGTLFRSSLEADWAATFDSLSIRWEYEPQHVRLPSGVGYLPDFHLPQLGTWVETKGPGIPGEDKAVEFAQMLACSCDDTCGCEWPGGEIVLIGRPSVRSMSEQRMRYGALHWHDALGGNALLIRCVRCDAWSWCRPRHSLTCRSCRHRHQGGHLHNSGEIEFRRAGRIPLPEVFS